MGAFRKADDFCAGGRNCCGDRMVVERESFKISVERKIQPKRNTATSTDPIKTITITKKDTSEDIMKNTLCIVDGKKISETELKNIDPNNIQSITVLKDEKSKEEYGATDKDCVIWITLIK